MRFVSAERLGPGHASVAKLVIGARYLVVFARSVFEGNAEAEIAQRCAAAMQASQLPIIRDSKGIKRTLDVRPYLAGLVPAGEEAKALFVRAGLSGDLVAFHADVRITPSGACKVSEIVTAMFGDAVPHRGIRVDVVLDDDASANAAVAQGQSGAAPSSASMSA